jgi:putative ABC transport system permease protein
MTVKPQGHSKASLSVAHVGSGQCLKRNETGTHMSLLVGTFTIGFILSLLALGVFISFRIFAFPDITADGSVTLGASVAATLLVHGVTPPIASLAAFGAGMLAGACTGTLHTRFKINPLLSGILVMTALYSINLHVMGSSNVPLLSVKTLATQSEGIGLKLMRGATSFDLLGWDVSVRDASVLGAIFLSVLLTGTLLYWFLRTNLGMAMRATGDNVQMIRALGVNDGNMIVFGLAISNGFVALSGALLAQYQGFADVGMGIGMVVWGLASVIIGEALVGTNQLGSTIVGTVMGSVLFRLMVAVALRWGLSPNDLKLITAAFVFVALIVPQFIRKGRIRSAHA